MTLRAFSLVTLMLLLGCGCGGDRDVPQQAEATPARETSASRAAALPMVDLQSMEPAVASAIEQATRRVAEASHANRATRLAELAETYQAYELFRPAAQVWQLMLEEREDLLLAEQEQARALYLLAVTQQRLGEEALAASNLEAAFRLAPSNRAVALRLAQVRLAGGQLEAAVELLGRQIEQLRNSGSEPAVLALFQARLGAAAIEQQDWAVAAASLEAALDSAPEVRAWRFQLARALRELATAEGDALQTAALDERARQLLEQAGDDGEPALQDRWLAAVAARATGASALLRQADAASLAGDGAAALELYRQAIEAAPDRSESWQSLAAELARQKQLEEAVAALDQAAELDPTSIVLRSNRASLLISLAVEAVREQRIEAALALASRSVELSQAQDGDLDGTSEVSTSEIRERQLVLATIQVLAGRWRAAASTLEQAHARDPADPAIAVALARLLSVTPEFELQNGARSMELARQALDSDGSFEAAQVVGLAMARLGSFDQAVSWHGQLLERARAQGVDAETIVEIETDLALFRAGKPRTEPLVADPESAGP